MCRGLSWERGAREPEGEEGVETGGVCRVGLEMRTRACTRTYRLYRGRRTE